MDDDKILVRLQDFLEEIWGTAWGEAECAAYERIRELVRDPESTQRHRLT